MKRTYPLNSVRALAVTATELPARTAIPLLLAGCALMFLVLQIGTTWLVLQLGAPFLVLAFRRNLLKPPAA